MKTLKPSRRQILQASAIAAGVVTTGLRIGSASGADDNEKKQFELRKKDTILFQGDSITDAQRNRKLAIPNNAKALGAGYPTLIASDLLLANPALNLKIFNRGVSGNKVPDLQKRWQADCLDLKPRLLSILIGVNDIWHKLNGGYDGTVEDYKTGFMALIEQTQKALPETEIVICEPFVLKCGAVSDKWFPEFDQRRAAAKEVAESAGTLWVPFQTMFNEVCASGDIAPSYWAGDGVHPSLAGHALMGVTWQKVVGLDSSAADAK